MGKRKAKAKKPAAPKKREPLPTSFNCLFCNHEDAVTCKLDKKAGVGSLSCKVCGVTFQSHINYLSHAVDVYSEWVDACDEVANKASPSTKRGGSGSRPRDPSTRDMGGGASSDLEDEDDGIRRRAAPLMDDDDEEDM